MARTQPARRRARGGASSSRYSGDGYYGGTITARKVAPETVERRRSPSHREKGSDRRRARISRRKTKNKKRRIQPIYEFVKNPYAKTSLLTYVLAGTVFIGTLMCVVTFAVKSGDLYMLNSLKTEYKRLYDENVNYVRDSYNNYNLAEIDKICREQYGMREPQEHQKKYVDVPNESYVVQYDTDEAKNEGNGLKASDVFNIFLNIFKD